MGRVIYKKAKDVESLVRDIVKTLGFNHINLENVKCVRSFNSKSLAIARIYGLPKVFQVAFNLKPLYVIEVLSEKFDRLSYIEKVRVLIHELLHIPKNFSGSLLPHKNYVEEKRVNELLREYLNKKNIFGKGL